MTNAPPDHHHAPRRWPFKPRFGLRSLFIFMTLVAVGIGFLGVNLYREHRASKAVEAVQAAGGQVVRNGDGHVVRVYVAGQQFGDLELELLVDHLAWLSHLRELDLVSNAVTDRGLSSVHRLPQLQELYVYETKVSDAGLKKFQTKASRLVVKAQAPDPIATSLAMRTIYPHAAVAARFSTDGKYLAAGSGSGELHVWRSGGAGEMRLKSRQAHQAWTFAVAFHPQKNLLATGGGDGVIRLWRLPDLSPAGELVGHDDDVHAVVISGDGETLYSTGDDKTIAAWSLLDNKLLRRWRAHDATIPSLAINPDGSLLASGARDATIKLWNAADGSLVGILSGHGKDVLSVTFSPNGTRLASASYDRTVRVWDVSKRRQILLFDDYSDWAFAVAFSPAGARLATGAGDGSIRLYDLATGDSLATFSPGGAISSVAFDSRGLLLAASRAEGDLLLWDTSSGKLLHTLPTVYDGRQGLDSIAGG